MSEIDAIFANHCVSLKINAHCLWVPIYSGSVVTLADPFSITAKFYQQFIVLTH
jgi:hypothetical protein